MMWVRRRIDFSSNHPYSLDTLLVEHDSQSNAPSIQETVEFAISKLIQSQTKIIAAGRTDAGVHARGQVANFKLTKDINVDNIKMGINANLPEDIVIVDIAEVPDDFHSRFDAKERIYQYFIKLGSTAVWRDYCLQYFQKINPEFKGNETFGWETNQKYYLLGKWADVKHSFDDLKEMAKKRYIEQKGNEYRKQIKEAQRSLDDLETEAFEKFN